MWGKRGEAEHNDHTLTCYDEAAVFATVFNPRTIKVEVAFEGIACDNKPYVELKVWRDEPFGRPMKFANAAACSFTTANARIRLHKMLLRLHPSQLIYCDTDSCKYWVDPSNSDHWDPELVPDPNIPLGDGLGEWENECRIDKNKGIIAQDIVGVVVLGPKSYCVKVRNTFIDGTATISEIIKAKGITMNDTNCQTITYDSMKEIALGIKDEIRARMFQFILKGHGGTIRTNSDADRTLKKNLHKRFEAPPGFGVPYVLYPPRQAYPMWKEYHERNKQEEVLSTIKDFRVGQKRPRS